MMTGGWWMDADGIPQVARTSSKRHLGLATEPCHDVLLRGKRAPWVGGGTVPLHRAGTHPMQTNRDPTVDPSDRAGIHPMLLTIVQLTTVSAGLSVPLKREPPYGYYGCRRGGALSNALSPEHCWFFPFLVPSSCPAARNVTRSTSSGPVSERGRAHRRGEGGEREDTVVDEKEPTRKRR